MSQRPIFPSPSPPSSVIPFGQLLVCDENSGWFYGVTQYNLEPGYYSHRGQQENKTGSLDFGYYKLNNKLCLKVAGGGGTNGNLKLIQILDASQNLLISTTLGSLLGANSDSQQLRYISTTEHKGKLAFVRFTDNDAGSAWAWIGFSLIVVE